jgi:signal peptidase II
LGHMSSISTARVYALLLITALIVVAVDQLSKQLALSALEDGPVEIIGGVLTLRLVFNPGGAFGLFQGLPGLFLVATVAVVMLILVWARRVEDRRWTVPLGMILGGGLGNLSDRVVRDLDGRVVDFIDLHVWPVFNLADTSIVLGAGLILLFGARARQEQEAPERGNRR